MLLKKIITYCYYSADLLTIHDVQKRTSSLILIYCIHIHSIALYLIDFWFQTSIFRIICLNAFQTLGLTNPESINSMHWNVNWREIIIFWNFYNFFFWIHRGEKLYVTKDKRLKATNWRKRLFWIIGLALCAAVIIVACLLASE